MKPGDVSRMSPDDHIREHSILRVWSLCCAFIVVPTDCIASYCCNQRLINSQCEISEKEQAHQINIAQFIFLTLIKVLHKVTYKVFFMNLKHGATINVHPMYWLTYYSS